MTAQDHATRVLEAWQMLKAAGVTAEDRIEFLIAQSMLPPAPSETELDIALSQISLELVNV